MLPADKMGEAPGYDKRIYLFGRVMSDEVKKYNVDMDGVEYEDNEGKYVKCEDHERIVKELQDKIIVLEMRNNLIDEDTNLWKQNALDHLKKIADLTAKVQQLEELAVFRLNEINEWIEKRNKLAKERDIYLQALEKSVQVDNHLGHYSEFEELRDKAIAAGKALRGEG